MRDEATAWRSGSRRKRVRFDFLELVLISAFAGLAVWAAAEFRIPPEARQLAAAYGPHRNSEHYEEWIVRDFFHDRHGGFFVDVGANHYRKYNNTYYLETSLGWSGIAVEPLTQFEAGYRMYRPATRFRSFFVSDVSHAEATMYLLDSNSLVSSGNKSFTERYGTDARPILVPTITLDDLLEAEQVRRIDFVSMDIELHEPKALAGFDLSRWKPALVCIEAQLEVRQQIIDYFIRRQYTLIGKYLRADSENLYFAPLPDDR